MTRPPRRHSRPVPAAGQGWAGARTAAGRHAGGSSFNIPTDGQSSPLFGAQPFTQKLGLFEEFGTLPMPGSYSDTNWHNLPSAGSCQGAPDTNELDAFLKQPMYPQPTRGDYETL